MVKWLDKLAEQKVIITAGRAVDGLPPATDEEALTDLIYGAVLDFVHVYDGEDPWELANAFVEGRAPWS